MYEIRELSGQDYVDEYATRTPEALPSQPAAMPVTGNGEEAGDGGADATAAAGTLASASAR
jgi:hypothetical protein